MDRNEEVRLFLMVAVVLFMSKALLLSTLSSRARCKHFMTSRPTFSFQYCFFVEGVNAKVHKGKHTIVSFFRR